MPVIIYAILRFGSYPVQNAIVDAMIERPDGQNITMRLNDDGKGGNYFPYTIIFFR